MTKFIYSTMFTLTSLHIMAIIGFIQYSCWIYNPYILMIQCMLQIFSGISATAGAHRLFVHQSYEALLPLHIFYIIGILMGFTGSPIGWIKAHRTHHQYTDTDLDPHNSKRGLFHSHFGWIIREIPQNILQKREQQDVTTLKYLKLHEFVDKYYNLLGALITFGVPYIVFYTISSSVTYIDIKGLFWTTIIRCVIGINMAASVNSFAHAFGERPYSQNISAFDNALVSIFTWGEGWHNYHHSYQKDYRCSGHNNFIKYWNPAHVFILLTAYLGLSYNLKTFCHDGNTKKYVITFKK